MGYLSSSSKIEEWIFHSSGFTIGMVARRTKQFPVHIVGHRNHQGSRYGIGHFPEFIQIQPAQGDQTKTTAGNEQRFQFVMGLFIAWPKGNKDKYHADSNE